VVCARRLALADLEVGLIDGRPIVMPSVEFGVCCLHSVLRLLRIATELHVFLDRGSFEPLDGGFVTVLRLVSRAGVRVFVLLLVAVLFKSQQKAAFVMSFRLRIAPFILRLFKLR